MTSPWTLDNVSQSSSSVPQNCIILAMNTTIPWNNPNNLISLEAEFLFDRIKATIIIPVLFLIGFPANCINMAVFFKQGLKDRINLCLFSLAVVDIITLTVVFTLYAERLYSQFTDGERIGVVYRYAVNNNLIGLFGIGYGIMFLSVIISAERCICILFPMRAQSMSSKEIGVTKMLIALSIEFFILFIPVIILRIVPVFEPRLSPGDELANFFNLLVGVSEIFANISSSMNFFVYYSTGRKFRETLHCMIRRKTAPKRKQDSKSDSTTIASHTLTSVTQAACSDIQDK